MIEWRHLDTTYEIVVSNPDGVWNGVLRAQLDGVVVDYKKIPLVNDGASHAVQITMGRR